MSSTTPETMTQRSPVSTKVEHEDFLMNKIIEQFRQLTFDPDFQKASATYSQVKDQQDQIQIRDEKLDKLQKHIKAQEENELVALSRFSAVNQALTTQKEKAEKENASLRKAVTEREKSLTEISRRIQELQGQIQTQLSERSQDERRMTSIIAQHNLDIGSLQRRLTERDTSVDEMKATTANLESLLAKEQTKSVCLETEKKSLDENMQKARSRLEKFDAFILKPHQIDEQSIIDRFEGIWDYAINEIWTVLRQNLSDENLKNDRAWKKFRLDTAAAIRDGAIQGQPAPLSASNSDAAKGMRLAVMLGILSREIDNEIFQPSYFPSETGNFRMSLNKLAKSDNEKERFYRSVLLSIDRDGQETELQSRAKSVVQNVSHYLYELLSTAQYGELKERIKNVVDRAIEVWRPIQNSTKRYETEFDPVDWAHDEDSLFQFPVGGEDTIGAEHQDDHLCVIFPGLFSLERDDALILTSVVPLMSSQRLYVAANQELREEVRGQSSPTTKQPSRKRQNSVAKAQSQSNGIGFLGGHSSGGSSN
ncbi:hypothetical protein N7489_003911 [Penicillium chrysogenum]|uniref:uncharacterized protein n=1 Tax=Penicillium chrysogenum TaxID=5076 RepID=UPI0024DF1137|nr:uncharacterized protein N7489_003911 [Penicillium chrysogenum]KAJ5243815.1 hypothetical protein N7489_003911 [Penicillium chrysogenum]